MEADWQKIEVFIKDISRKPNGKWLIRSSNKEVFLFIAKPVGLKNGDKIILHVDPCLYSKKAWPIRALWVEKKWKGTPIENWSRSTARARTGK